MAFTRKALLMAVPGKKTDSDYLKGAEADVELLRSFLMSNAGGAFEYKEIDVLVNPSRIEVLSKIVLLMTTKYNYLFTSVSAHGFELFKSSRSIPVINLTNNELIQVSDLYCGTAKIQNIIIDTCRGKVDLRESIQFSASSLQYQKTASAISIREQHRALFEHSMSMVEDGTIVNYACDVGQSAGEDKNGGYYTKALIDSARMLTSAAKASTVINFKQAHDMACDLVRKQNPQQSPQLGGGRRQRYPTIAVKA